MFNWGPKNLRRVRIPPPAEAGGPLRTNLWEWDVKARGIVEALAKLSDIPVHFDAGSSPALNIGGPDKPFWGNWLEALVHVAEWMPRNGSPFDFGGVEIPVDVQPGVEALPHKAPQIGVKEVPR